MNKSGFSILVFVLLTIVPGFDALAQSVSGQLLKNSGKPLAYTEIQLVPLTANKILNDPRLNAASNSAGMFSFRRVPPGSYTLSIKFHDKPTTLSPYATCFYPNTTQRSLAQIFEVTATTKIKGLKFRLPPALTQRKIVGRVIWSDGSPVSEAWIAFRDVEADKTINFQRALVDKNGVFKLDGFDNRKYQIAAILPEHEPSMFEPIGDVVAVAKSDIFVLDPTTPMIVLKLEKTDEGEKIIDKYVGILTFPF